jgi:hypothetical protein
LTLLARPAAARRAVLCSVCPFLPRQARTLFPDQTIKRSNDQPLLLHADTANNTIYTSTLRAASLPRCFLLSAFCFLLAAAALRALLCVCQPVLGARRRGAVPASVD